MNKRAALILLTLTAHAWAQALISTYAGNGNAGYSGDNGPATQAMINQVVGLAWDSSGNLYLADQNNNRVRKVDKNGVITTFAGTGTAGFSGDNGQATQAQLNLPTGVCTDVSGNVYINDNSNFRIRKVALNGVITTVAGSGLGSTAVGSTAGTVGDGGPATGAGFSIPIRCATDRAGNLYITDQGAHCVRRVNSSGVISTFAGRCIATSQTGSYSGDGGPSTFAALNNPTAVATDAPGNLYITDQGNQRIRKVDVTGVITTVAGNGLNSFGGDGGAATSASLSFPGETAVDAAGNIFIVDTVNQRIRKASGGAINTVAGTGTAGYSGDNGPPLQATLRNPFPIAVDAAGNLYVGDTSNNRIRKISGVASAAPPPFITSAGVTNAASFKTGITPGGIVTIFGTNLGAVPGQVIAATGGTWPAQLFGVSVTMDGVTAPVYDVLNLNGQEQISVQAPFALNGKNSANVQVTTAAGVSTSISVPVLTAQPGIFILDAAGNAATHADGSIITRLNPASLNEQVVLYVTGLGNVSNPPQPGQPASLNVPSPAVLQPQVAIGSSLLSPVFAGLTPGYIGLYQVNVVVPSTVPSGANLDVTIQSNNVVSNVAKLPVQ